MIRWVIMLWGMLVVQAAAQVVDFGRFERANTRFGSFTTPVTDQWGARQLHLNGQPTGIAERFVSILGAFAYPDSQSDWLLVEQAHGGNMCPTSYILVQASAKGMTRTAAFGDCLGGPIELRVLPDRIELDLGDPALGISHHTFVWDGGAGFTVTPVAVALGQHNGAVPTGRKLLEWVGKPASDILHDPAIQGQFLKIMAGSTIEDLRRQTGVPNAIEQRGNWILGSGCQAHMCNASAAAWGLRLSDGAPVAVFLARTAPDSWHGGVDAVADPVMRAYVEEHRWR